MNYLRDDINVYFDALYIQNMRDFCYLTSKIPNLKTVQFRHVSLIYKLFHVKKILTNIYLTLLDDAATVQNIYITHLPKYSPLLWPHHALEHCGSERINRSDKVQTTFFE